MAQAQSHGAYPSFRVGSHPETLESIASTLGFTRERIRQIEKKALVRILENDGPERQWLCGEILEELSEDHDLHDWFGAWNLASLLRESDQITYLGRLRVALPRASHSTLSDQ